MTRTTDRLGKTMQKAARKAGQVVRAAEKKVEKEIRRRQRKRTMRRAGALAATAAAGALAGAVVAEGGRALAGRRRARRALGFETELPMALDAAIERVTGALQHEGFGILTRIDVHATLREKLNLFVAPYTILGACNPSLAHRALSARSEAGLLLPCNVTVQQLPESGCQVRIADPDMMLTIGDLGSDPELQAVAAEARERLTRVMQHLEEAEPAPVA